MSRASTDLCRSSREDPLCFGKGPLPCTSRVPCHEVRDVRGDPGFVLLAQQDLQGDCRRLRRDSCRAPRPPFCSAGFRVVEFVRFPQKLPRSATCSSVIQRRPWKNLTHLQRENVPALFALGSGFFSSSSSYLALTCSVSECRLRKIASFLKTIAMFGSSMDKCSPVSFGSFIQFLRERGLET